MSLTNFKDFQTFFKLIPKDSLKNVWFFPIKQDRKNPDVPKGTILKGNVAYRMILSDCIKRLKSGKNIGIYALPQGIMFLDLDVKDKKIIASKSILEDLDSISTLKIRTRNGGYQYYFLNEGKYANQLLEENNKVIGELRTNWYYVVSVGSYVPTDEHNLDGDGTYRIVSGDQIKQFPGIPGIDLKLISDEDKQVTIHDTKAHNVEGITHSQHLRELAKAGVVTRKRRLK